MAIATERRIEGLVRQFNLEYAPIEGDPTGVIFLPEAQKPLAEGSFMALINLTKDWEKKFNKRDILNSYVTACAGADLIISAGLTMTPTFCVAEKMNVPWIPVILGPTLVTQEFPMWPLKNIIWCSCLYKWSYNVAFKMLWNSEKQEVNDWRKTDLGLPAIEAVTGIVELIDRSQPPIIVACSPLICPQRRAPLDYPPTSVMKGFVFVPPSIESDIDIALSTFLSADPQASGIVPSRKIVYLGFGSMPCHDVKKLVQMAIDLCKEAKCRAVVTAGWTDLSDPEYGPLLRPYIDNSTLIVVTQAPHDWLFPRMHCLIHHCGVGTLAAGLRSGVPQIPCPVMLDQFHNADTVKSLGCAAGVIPFTKLTAKKLAEAATKAFSDVKIQQSAKEVSEVIKTETVTSTETYCGVIEAYLEKFKGASK